MEALVEYEVPQGLGKKTIAILLTNEGGLLISIPDEGNAWLGNLTIDSAWVGLISEEIKSNLKKIIVPDDLSRLLISQYDDGDVEIAEQATETLRSLTLL